MSAHPRLYLLPGGQGDCADPFDGERRDRVGVPGRRFQIVPVSEAEREAGTEGIARPGLIYQFVRREAPDLDLPPAA